EGFRSGGYTYTAYKSGDSAPRAADVVVLSDAARRRELTDAFAATLAVEDLADTVRDWVNTPPNDFTPAAFADAAAGLAKGRKGLSATVFDVPQLEELGCGGILGVGMGSANPPRLVRLHWKPKKPVARIALVGKGITYDSGGLTIKPGGSMATMKNDMAGAAAVAGVLAAVADLDLPVEVVGFLPMAENMPSGSAMRPGDVLTIHGGKTVEIRNTDAEGRLVLADGLSLATETEPDAIVEISTLTGPCVVALGDRVAGLFGDDATTAAVEVAAREAGEMIWRMPIPDHISEAVRTESPIADVLQHNWVRWGSASWAAAFLTEFVGDVPFAHLDVAGPAWNGGSAWGDVPAGATGYGVRTLVRYVVDRAAAQA
ncbi:MAG: leucyl aminopeptidase, partial [Marmoricola sp.]